MKYFSFLIFFLLVGGVIFFTLQKNENGGIASHTVTQTGVMKSPSLSNSGSVDDLSVQLSRACSGAILGRPSDMISSSLYEWYTKNKNIEQENQDKDFFLLSTGKCNEIADVTPEFCGAMNSKDPEKLQQITPKGSLEQAVMLSFLLKTNKCDLVLNNQDRDACSRSVESFKYIQEPVGEAEKIETLSDIARYKLYIQIGKSKYMEKLDAEFLSKCMRKS